MFGIHCENVARIQEQDEDGREEKKKLRKMIEI